MKIFANTNIWKKIVIVFTVLTSLMFVAPKTVSAADASSVGGTLMKPICSFLVGVGDGVMDVIHEVMLKQGSSIIRINVKETFWEKIKIKAIIAVVFIVIVGIIFHYALPFVSGVLSTIVAPIGVVLGTSISIGAVATGIALVASVGGGVWVTTWVYNHGLWGNDEVVLPLYAITPEEIFRNDEALPLLSVNFFDEDTRTIEYNYEISLNQEDDTTEIEQEGNQLSNDDMDLGSYTTLDNRTASYGVPNDTRIGINQLSEEELNKKYHERTGVSEGITINEIMQDKYKTTLTQTWKNLVGIEKSEGEFFVKEKGDYQYALYLAPGGPWTLGVKRIKKDEGTNNTTANANNTDTATDKKESDESATVSGTIRPMSAELRKFVMAGYRALRYIAIVGMMSVLVYIGIRIVISSASSQKAKYKQLLGDWVVGMVLLFTMHYIMYFSNIFVDELSNFLNSINPCVNSVYIKDDTGKIEEKIKELGYTPVEREVGSSISETDIYDKNGREKNKVGKYKINNENYIEWFTNLMGALRVRLNWNAEGDSVTYIGYTVMFLVMIIYTISFLWTYTKRVIYMAFLTLIAPLVALTYPIDKVNDGSAQGFNFWFKEYIFNLLLQPMHLLIYTILVSAAIEFAGKNVIYGIVAIGFIGSAEKIVRKMFNFQKADTPGVFAGPAGAAAAFGGMRWLLGHGPHGGKGGGLQSGGSGNKENDDIGKLNNKDKISQQERLSGVKIDGSDEGGDVSQGEHRLLGRSDSVDDVGAGQQAGGVLNVEGMNPSETTALNGDGTDGEMQNNDGMIQADNGEMQDDEEMIQADYGDFGDMEYLDDMPENVDTTDLYSDLMSHPERDMFNKRYPGTDPVTPTETPINSDSLSNIDKIKDRAIKMGTGALNRTEGFRNGIKERARGLRGVAKHYWDKNVDQANDANYQREARRKIFRAVGGLTVGAAAATVGLASGVASGDAKAAFQNATIGAAAGYKVGKGMGDSTYNKGSEFHEVYKRERYTPEKYLQKQDEENQKKFVNNRNNIRKVADKKKISEREANKWLKENSEQYRRAGINDVEEMLAIEKTIGQQFQYYNSNGKLMTGTIGDANEAIGLYQIAQRVNTENVQGKDNTNKAIQRIQGMGFEDRERAEAMFYGSTVYGDMKNNTEGSVKGQWNVEDSQKRIREQQEKVALEQAKHEEEQKVKAEKEAEKRRKEEQEEIDRQERRQILAEIKEVKENLPKSRKKNRGGARRGRNEDRTHEPVNSRTKSKNRKKEAEEQTELTNKPTRTVNPPPVDTPEQNGPIIQPESTTGQDPITHQRPSTPQDPITHQNPNAPTEPITPQGGNTGDNS